MFQREQEELVSCCLLYILPIYSSLCPLDIRNMSLSRNILFYNYSKMEINKGTFWRYTQYWNKIVFIFSLQFTKICTFWSLSEKDDVIYFLTFFLNWTWNFLLCCETDSFFCNFTVNANTFKMFQHFLQRDCRLN